MKSINIHSKKHDYDVIIDDTLYSSITSFLEQEKRYFVIIDNKVEDYISNKILLISPNSLIIKVEGGEHFKSFNQYEKMLSLLLQNKFSKSDCIIAIGGGTVLDLAGYLAATYKRGMHLINIPTTTMAMLDASIGGKNALNVGDIKNSVGTIYPPDHVLIGLDLLHSLDLRNYFNGLFEALKMGMILDREIIDLLEMANSPEAFKEILYKCVSLKAKIVEQDEEDKGIRKILNFGHSFGHAYEIDSNYQLLHGEAVAHGILTVCRGMPYYQKIKSITKYLGLKEYTPSSKEQIMSIIANDKKSNAKTLDLIVVNELGKSEIVKKTLKEVEELL